VKLLDKLTELLGLASTRPVFIIGTGRTGTHWLANTFCDHPEIDLTVETQPMFGLSQQIALNPALQKKLFGKLVLNYQGQLKRSSRKLYIDKSHPNIWIAEELKTVFPNALFIGIERNPYATISSMMRHKGVLSWHRRWREFPIPNRFLGITEENADSYATTSLATQCAMRWVAHTNRMEDLRIALGSDLLVISYENFQEKTEDIIRDLEGFLRLRGSLPKPHVKKSSLQSWKTHLSSQDKEDIQRIVHLYEIPIGAFLFVQLSC
jgi:hypothetical protein